MTRPVCFNVLARSPHAGMDWGNLDPHVRRVYREINFMVHLMWEAPYEMIHGQFLNLIPHVRDCVNDDNRWPMEFDEARQALNDHLPCMLNDSAVQGGLTHLQLHLQHEPSAARFIDRTRELRNELEAILDDASVRVPKFPVCFPFIEAQERQLFTNDPRTVIDAATAIQGRTMHDLYYMNGIRGLTPAIKVLRDAFVLRTRPPENSAKSGFGNGYRCQSDGASCVQSTDPNCYCSLDANGQCSAMTTC